jgi:hypothetical protein
MGENHRCGCGMAGQCAVKNGTRLFREVTRLTVRWRLWIVERTMFHELML